MFHLRSILFSLLAFSLFMIFPAGEAAAQQIGFTAGINTSTHLNNFRFISGDINLDFSPRVKTGFSGGMIVRQDISRNVRFQAEPSIAMLGAKYKESFTLRGFNFETDSKTQLTYIQLPLLLQLTTTPPDRVVYGRQRSETTYHLTTGVFGGYLLDARFTGVNSGAPIGIEFQGAFTENVIDQYKVYDGGVILGGGFEHGHISKLGIEARALFSVIDSGDASNFSFKPQNLAVTLSVYYLFR
jgi:hypothetical protein